MAHDLSSNSAVSTRPSTPDSAAERLKNSSQDSFAHLNHFDSKSPFADSGNYPHIHYKTKIHPLRFKVRQWLLPYVRAETPILASIQQKLRTPLIDFYFAYTANLASHTFYVLMLPLPIWFGYGNMTRDLVFMLGYGIYFSGFAKDFCCLPRPRSPPLHRITMSGYTAKEYGFPSSHAANATAVSVFMLNVILSNADKFESNWTLAAALITLGLYYNSLIFGRIYCGMHGFSDLAVGSFIGLLCYFIRVWTGPYWDSLILKGSGWYLVASALTNYALIYYHVEPVDDCPCYDDSVAFIGVIIGLEFSQWVYSHSSLNVGGNGMSCIDIPYSFQQLGLVKSLLRVLLGVSCVAIWKEISKPLLFKIIKPFYSLLVSEPDKDATTFNRIRSDTMKKREKLADVPELVKQIGKHEQQETVGPQSAIDERELEELRENQAYFTELDKMQRENVIFTCGVFKSRYDLSIIVRLIVYAGIPFCAVIIFPILTQICGLAVELN